MGLKVKVKTFESFLKKATMSGKQQVKTTILDFTSDGLKIIGSLSDEQSTRSTSTKHPASFIEYEAIGKVPMNDVDVFINLLKRFNDDVSIKKEGNLLVVSEGNKKVGVELVSENFVPKSDKTPDLEFANVFEMDSKKLSEIIADASMSSDAVITIQTFNGEVKFSNTGKYKFEHIVEAVHCKEGSKVSFGQPFVDAVKNLDGILTLNVKTDYPIAIVENTDETDIEILVVPKVVEE